MRISFLHNVSDGAAGPGRGLPVFEQWRGAAVQHGLHRQAQEHAKLGTHGKQIPVLQAIHTVRQLVQVVQHLGVQLSSVGNIEMPTSLRSSPSDICMGSRA